MATWPWTADLPRSFRQLHANITEPGLYIWTTLVKGQKPLQRRNRSADEIKHWQCERHLRCSSFPQGIMFNAAETWPCHRSHSHDFLLYLAFACKEHCPETNVSSAEVGKSRRLHTRRLLLWYGSDRRRMSVHVLRLCTSTQFLFASRDVDGIVISSRELAITGTSKHRFILVWGNTALARTMSSRVGTTYHPLAYGYKHHKLLVTPPRTDSISSLLSKQTSTHVFSSLRSLS